jgi:hypothetical protein
MFAAPVAAAGLDDVGVERALHEELDAVRPRRATSRLLLEDADELAADDLALGLGVGDAGEVPRNWSFASTTTRARPRSRDEVALDLLGLALAQQAVVDEDAGELVADGPLHERGGDRGVDAAGQPADHPLVADLLADRGDLVVDDVGHVQAEPSRRCRTGSATAPSGRARCAAPRGGTARRPAARDVLERGDRRARGRGVTVKPAGAAGDGVAVAHPHR